MHPYAAFLQVPVVWRSSSSRRHACSPSRKWTCSVLDPSVAFVLSHFEAGDLLLLKKQKAETPVLAHGPFSIDVGMRTLDELLVLPDGIGLPLSASSTAPAVLATWSELKKMSKKGRSGAFEVFLDGRLSPCRIAGISETTQRTASLLPCARGKPPTMVLGGFGMHRLKGTDPGADTMAKLGAVGGGAGLRGQVLDVCTGLGYTALGAAEAAGVEGVTTVEMDAVVVGMQRRNPWSQGLFTHGKVRRVEGEATRVVGGMGDGVFSAVIHDPPAMAMGGELYGLRFYRELRRVCKRGAGIFHYVGDAGSRESGRLYRGVVKRLVEAGFTEVREEAEAYGVSGRAG